MPVSDSVIQFKPPPRLNTQLTINVNRKSTWTGVQVRTETGDFVLPSHPDYLAGHLAKVVEHPVVPATLTMDWDDWTKPKDFTTKPPIKQIESPNVVYYLCGIYNYGGGVHMNHAVTVTAVRDDSGYCRMFLFNPWGEYSAEKVTSVRLALDKEILKIMSRHMKPGINAKQLFKELANNKLKQVREQDSYRYRSEIVLLLKIQKHLVQNYNFDKFKFQDSYMYNGVNLQERDKSGICSAYAAMFIVDAPLSLFESAVSDASHNGNINNFGKTLLMMYDRELLDRLFYTGLPQDPVTGAIKLRSPSGVGLKRKRSDVSTTKTRNHNTPPSQQTRTSDDLAIDVFFKPIAAYHVYTQNTTNPEKMYSVDHPEMKQVNLSSVTTTVIKNKKNPNTRVMVHTFGPYRFFETVNKGNKYVGSVHLAPTGEERLKVLAFAMMQMCKSR